METAETDGGAIAAFVFILIGITAPLPFLIIGASFNSAARKRIARSGGRLKGAQLCRATSTIAGTMVIVYVIAVVIVAAVLVIDLQTGSAGLTNG